LSQRKGPVFDEVKREAQEKGKSQSPSFSLKEKEFQKTRKKRNGFYKEKGAEEKRKRGEPLSLEVT